MSVDFIDSNVFIYLFEKKYQRKWQIAVSLIQGALKNSSAVISFQVVQETMSVISRKLANPATHQDTLQFLDKVMYPLWKVNPSRELYRRGLEIQARYKFSFYDSLIIAAALEAGCKTLYSEDLQHGQQIESLTIENPFHEP